MERREPEKRKCGCVQYLNHLQMSGRGTLCREAYISEQCSRGSDDINYDIISKGWSCFSDIISRGWGCFSDIIIRGWGCFSDIISRGWGCFSDITSKGWGCFSDITSKGWGCFSDFISKGWGCFSDFITWCMKREGEAREHHRLPTCLLHSRLHISEYCIMYYMYIHVHVQSIVHVQCIVHV